MPNSASIVNDHAGFANIRIPDEIGNFFIGTAVRGVKGMPKPPATNLAVI
jgi:hypothetical protein